MLQNPPTKNEALSENSPKPSSDTSSNTLSSLHARISAKIPNFPLRSPTEQRLLNAAQRYERTFRVSDHLIHVLGLSYALILGTTLGAVMASPIAFTLNTFLTLNFGGIVLGLAFWSLYKATQKKFRYGRSFSASVAFIGAFVFGLCFPSTLMASTFLHPMSFFLQSHFLNLVILYPFFPSSTLTTQYALALYGLLLFCTTAPITFQTLGLCIGFVISKALLTRMRHWDSTRMVCAKIKHCLPTTLPKISRLLSREPTPQPAPRPNLACLFDPLIHTLQYIHKQTPKEPGMSNGPVFGDLSQVNNGFHSTLKTIFNQSILEDILRLKQELQDPTSYPSAKNLQCLDDHSKHCSAQLAIITSIPAMWNDPLELKISPKQFFSAYPASTSMTENYSWTAFFYQAIGGTNDTPRDEDSYTYESMAKTEFSYKNKDHWKIEMDESTRCTLTLLFQCTLAIRDFTGIQQFLKAHQEHSDIEQAIIEPRRP